jgi:quinol monooxygenase YgiN
MSILVRFEPQNLTKEQYQQVIDRLEESSDNQPEGRELHVCFGDDGSMRVSEVWDSQEAFEAYGEKLMPVLTEVGIEAGEPEVLEVHNTIVR